MLSPQALIRGLVQRLLPTQPNPDGGQNDVAFRLDAYGGLYSQPMVRKNSALVDEGSYWLVNSGQTGITPPLGIAYSATVAAAVIYNGDFTYNRKLSLDFLTLTNIVAVTCTTGTANTPCYLAVAIDNINRYSSGGTALTLLNPNMAANSPTPSITAYFGNITAAAASANNRLIIPQQMWRGEATTAAITIVGDQLTVNFGGVEMANMGSPTYTNPSIIPLPAPGIIIGPGQSAVVHMWWPNFTPAGASSGYLPSIGFWMR